MSGNKEKRMIAETGYEVIHAIRIGDSEILIAENMDEPLGIYYMKAEHADNGTVGQYDSIFHSSDYCAVMDAFTFAIERQTKTIRAENAQEGFQHKLITEGECYPHDRSRDITGKLVAIKAEALRPEYRRGDRQLVLVHGGSGATGNLRGGAVFCHHLNNGRQARFVRQDVMGEIKELPAWAVERLTEIKAEIDGNRNPAQITGGAGKAAGYTVTERIQAGSKHFAMGENPGSTRPFATWQYLEGRPGHCHWHYFSNIRRARIDLHARAKKERVDNGVDKAGKTKYRNDAR